MAWYQYEVEIIIREIANFHSRHFSSPRNQASKFELRPRPSSLPEFLSLVRVSTPESSSFFYKLLVAGRDAYSLRIKYVFLIGCFI